ncbi:DOMON-like domain-containing protein [Viridibacterium curvum]|uniref:DOMON-like domain-containing protein n=1 Tax=Viridibacterium curvum TaxID=1101404 RepID=UPI0031E95ABF
MHCYPGSPGAAPLSVYAGARCLADGALQLRFSVQGDAAGLRLPQPVAQAGFADGLWQHTCFEAFVGVAGSSAYREFNLSPSGQWAAYAFADYRQRDERWQAAQAPQFSVQRTDDGLTIDALIPAALLPVGEGVDISLTAVIEAADGHLGYWALSHAGERPDFHKRASFVLRPES